MKKSEMGEDKNNKGSKFKRPESMTSKNKMRMGGKGLSLEAFANAKSKTDYNPALISMFTSFLCCFIRLFLLFVDFKCLVFLMLLLSWFGI